MKHHLIESYERDLPLLKAIKARAVARLNQLLQAHDISVHSLSSRLKAPASLNRKLSRPDRTYHQLVQVTDLVGLRVITYFEDTIETIAALVEKEFEIDYDHSIDKRKSLDASRFGYSSLHYVCRLRPQQGAIIGPGPEDAQALRSYPFEIQIRTILQHAWAETEHDLGYKSETGVPLEIRRRFSRVASLLEIADAEFVSIRRFLDEYRDSVAMRLKDPDASVDVDRVSLEQFLCSSAVCELEADFAACIGVPLSHEVFYPDYLLRMLAAVEVTDIAELREALLSHRDELRGFIKPYFAFTRSTWQFTGSDLGHFKRGYSLVFLAHYLLLKDNPLALVRLERLTSFYQQIDYPHDEAEARAVAKNLLAALDDRPADIDTAPIM